MMNDTITWSLNTATQKQSKNNPAKEVEHIGPLEEVLVKLLPSMGRSDIPSHLISIIKHYGHGVLELPGTQRWDGLRLYYRCDKADIILDYDAYKSDLSVNKIKPDGTISIDSMSEMKLPSEFGEKEMKDVKHVAHVPLRWMGESEVNPEAIVDYQSLAAEHGITEATGITLETGWKDVNDRLKLNSGIKSGELTGIPTSAEIVDQSGLYDLAEGYSHCPFDQTGPRDEESIKREIELRRKLDIARGRNNTRIGALGEPIGSIEEVKKAKDALKAFLADKKVKLVVADANVVGSLRTINPADLLFTNHIPVDRNMWPDAMLNFEIIKGRGANSDFDGDQIQVPAGMESLRIKQWRTRNPDIATFIKEGRELYEGSFKPITVLKTNFEDYVLLVNLVRRDIYRNDMFLSAALLVIALHSWGGIVRADRKTALRFIKKTYRKCTSGRFRHWLTHAIWEHKNMMMRSMLMDGSKRELIGNMRGWKRRTVKDVMREYPTLTSVCMVDDPKEK